MKITLHRSTLWLSLPIAAGFLLALAGFLLVAAVQPAWAGANPKILVNEFYRSGDFGAAGDEWLEVVVIQELNAAALEGFYTGDSTSATASKYAAYQFTSMGDIAPSFLPGSLIVIAGGGTPEDLSYDPAGGDWNIILSTTGVHLTGNGNTGNYAATDVAWVDTASSGSAITADGFGVNWDDTPGALGAAADVTIPAPANGSGAALQEDLARATDPASWSTSIAPASLTPGQPNGGNNTIYILSLRTSLNSFRILKIGPALVSPGELFTYTLAITNSTGVTTTGTVITDVLPANAGFVSASGGGVYANGVVSWTVSGALPSGAVITRTFQVTAAAIAGEVIVNAEYAVHADNWLTLTYGAPISSTVSPLEMGINKDAPVYGTIGKNLDYTITLQTQGVATATGVLVTDTLPLSVTYVSDTSGITPTQPATGTLVWNLGDLPPDTTFSFVLSVDVSENTPSGTTLTNTIQATTTAPDGNAADNQDSAQTIVYPLVSIVDIQYVPDPGTDDASPYVGQTVWVEGIVTAQPGEIDIPTRSFNVEDSAGGPWSGLLVYSSAGFDTLNAPAGTLVQVLGTVSEYFQLTELNLGSGPAAVNVLASGLPVPDAAILPTGDFVAPATAEQWESVYIRFEEASVTDTSLGFGEWAFNDGSGATVADDLGNRDGNLGYLPNVGDYYTFIQGIGWFSFSVYKLEPRSDGDIGLLVEAPEIVKSAPANVNPGELFTYTITLANQVGYTLTSIVITDALPAANADFAYALDGGVESGGVVAWNAASLPDQSSLSVRFVVTATGAAGSVIANEEYAFTAAEWPTRTFGAPALTVIGDYTPIPIIQGNSESSPFDGVSLKTRGVVVGFFEGNYPGGGVFDGFFIQDASGDANAATSDGLYVNHGTLNINVNIGDLVEVNGTVQEFDEYDGVACTGAECLTEIAVSSVGNVTVIGSGAIATAPLDPPGDPAAAFDYYEAHEGMLVTLPMTGVVVGPTSFGTITVVPGDEGVSRVMRGSAQEGMTFGVRHWERFGEVGGLDAPNLIVGSVVDNVDGPLTWTYGDFIVTTQTGDAWSVVSEQPLPGIVPSWPAPGIDQFSLAAFNTYNFDPGGGTAKMDKVVATLVQLNGPAFISLEEISPTVLTELTTELSNEGFEYSFAYSHPDIGGHGVAMLWRSDIVTDVVFSDQYQSCSANGSSSSTYDPMWAACQALGQYPLFARRPLVVTGTVLLDGGELQVVAIANHFKAKDGTTSADLRRLEEAQFVAALVDELVANGSSNVVVMGDLNDFEDSAPINALLASETLTDTWFTLLPEARYSYIFHGVSQILDHILVSQNLSGWLEAMGPLHLNADYPYKPYADDGTVVWRTSDHEPVAATFTVTWEQPLLKIFLPIILSALGGR